MFATILEYFLKSVMVSLLCAANLKKETGLRIE